MFKQGICFIKDNKEWNLFYKMESFWTQNEFPHTEQ